MKQNKAKNYFYFTMLSKAFEAINSLDDEGLKNRDSLLGVLDSFLVTLKKPIKNILYKYKNIHYDYFYLLMNKVL